MKRETASSRRRILLGLGTLATGTIPLTTSAHTESPTRSHQETTTTTDDSTVPPGTSPDKIVEVGDKGTVTSEYGDEEVTFWVKDLNTFEDYIIGDDQVTADGIFVAVAVTARNDSDERVTIGHDQFELVTAEGYAFTTGQEPMLDYDDTFWVVGLDSQTMKTRYAIFDAPANSDPWWLKISAGELDDAPPVYFALPM